MASLKQLLAVCVTALLNAQAEAIPAAAASPAQGSFTYYNSLQPLEGPCDLSTGPDGDIWSQNILANKLGRINPSTGKVTEYDIPYTVPPFNATPPLSSLLGRVALGCAIQPGLDGMMYSASGLRNQLVRINPSNGKIDIFTPPGVLQPLGDILFLNDLFAFPDGMVFSQTTGNVLTHFNYKTEKFTTYQIPTPVSGPVGVFRASDEGVWFVEFFAGKVGRLDLGTGKIDEYPVPASLLGPAVVRAETEGRYIWFTAFTAQAMGRFDIYNHTFTTFTDKIPLGFPTEDTVDDKGNVWFSTATRTTLNKIDPNGQFTYIEQPGTIIEAPVSVPPKLDIAMHYDKGTNSMWFTEVLANRVGRYQL